VQGHGQPRRAAGRAGSGAQGGVRALSATHVHPLRVRFAECDPQGIVFNARYLEYFDVAITEFWRDTVGPYDEATEANQVELVVAEAGIRYLSSLRFDDEFELRTTIARLGTTSITTAIAVARAGDVVAEGELRHVFLDRGSGATRPIPDAVRAAFTPFLVSAG
jgi:acyl-CoA thioester hydrolase